MKPSTAFTCASASRRLARSSSSGCRSLHRDRADADRAAGGVVAGHPRVGGDEVRMRPGIEPRFGRLVAGKPGQPVGDIGRIARLRHLAVVDDVDAGLGLAPHDREHRLAGQPRQRSGVVGSSLSFATSSSRNAGGRGRLPVWVVRMRSLLVFIASPPLQPTSGGFGERIAPLSGLSNDNTQSRRSEGDQGSDSGARIKSEGRSGP